MKGKVYEVTFEARDKDDAFEHRGQYALHVLAVGIAGAVQKARSAARRNGFIGFRPIGCKLHCTIDA